MALANFFTLLLSRISPLFVFFHMITCVENKKRESKQREEGENAERRGRETERRGREGRD